MYCAVFLVEYKTICLQKHDVFRRTSESFHLVNFASLYDKVHRFCHFITCNISFYFKIRNNYCFSCFVYYLTVNSIRCLRIALSGKERERVMWQIFFCFIFFLVWFIKQHKIFIRFDYYLCDSFSCRLL